MYVRTQTQLQIAHDLNMLEEHSERERLSVREAAQLTNAPEEEIRALARELNGDYETT